jgi:hypothetical protein
MKLCEFGIASSQSVKCTMDDLQDDARPFPTERGETHIANPTLAPLAAPVTQNENNCEYA